jgi:hypothetical protein
MPRRKRLDLSRSTIRVDVRNRIWRKALKHYTHGAVVDRLGVPVADRTWELVGRQVWRELSLVKANWDRPFTDPDTPIHVGP